MSGKDLELKTKEELLDLAGDHGIPVTRSLLKREIVALLRKSLSKKTKKNPLPGLALQNHLRKRRKRKPLL